jgi:hypothetical protein
MMIETIKRAIKALLVTIIWGACLSFILAMFLQLHFVGKIAEFNEAQEMVSHSYNTESFILNKKMAFEYNTWLAYWQQLDKVPVIDFFIPRSIHSLKPMTWALPDPKKAKLDYKKAIGKK